MPSIINEPQGSATIPITEYLELRQRAQAKEQSKENAIKRQAKLEAAAKELEQFLSFLYKNVKFNMESYVNAFNSKSTKSQIILNEDTKKVKIKLNIDNEGEKDNN